MTAMKRPRAEKPLKERTRKQRLAAYRILHAGARRGPRGIYDPEVHPDSLVAYFKKAYDALADSKRITTDKGQVSNFKASVRPPTLSGYAAEIGVSRDTLWSWGEKYDEFKDAIGVAKAIQEQVFVEMGLEGGYNANVTIFVLKNLQEWTDKVQSTHRGSIVLKVDEQDLRA